MIYWAHTLRLSLGFLIQNAFRGHNIQPAFKIGRKFDHTLTRYHEHRFIWNLFNIYYYAQRLPIQNFTNSGRLCGESERTSCAWEAARERHIVGSTVTFCGHVYNHAPPTFRSASKIVSNWTLIESLLNHFLLLPRFLQCAIKDLAEIPTPSLDFKFQAAHSSSPKCWLGKTESINHLPWPCALLIDRETCLRHDRPNQYNSYRTLPTPYVSECQGSLSPTSWPNHNGWRPALPNPTTWRRPWYLLICCDKI